MDNKTSVVLTWGCSHNQKDSQIIEKRLEELGFNLISNSEYQLADLVVVNTCTVKKPTENKIIHILDILDNLNKQVIITGCLSQSEPKYLEKKYPKFAILGVNAIRYIDQIIGKNNKIIDLPMLNDPSLNNTGRFDNWIDKTTLQGKRWNPNLEIIQINEGCVNSCTFCATKNARGRLHSSSRKNVISAVRKSYTPEIWLTSQDTGCWGFDSGDSLANLLNEIDKIDRKLWIRVGMANPNNVIKILDELIEAYKSEKIFKFLHLPLQAGNDDVLKHMKRGYTVETYLEIIQEFRRKIPKITISTDIICGYPTETDLNFLDTINAIEISKPDICNISRYWERRNTEASKLIQLPHNIRKDRSKRISEIMFKIQLKNNVKWIDWRGTVICNEIGSKGGIQARNIYYKPIILHEDINLGSWQNVVITDCTETYFIGKLID